MRMMPLFRAIASGDAGRVSRLLNAAPALARGAETIGVTRAGPRPYFLEEIGHYVYAGDTALHVAAAAYQSDIVERLIALGADVHARNRRGAAPIHYAADGRPGSCGWDPERQTATIAALIRAGADPNAFNNDRVTPLHRAIRTRSAAAVRALIELGADPKRRNGSGSTPLSLAVHDTGRGGSGSPEARRQQAEIIAILNERLAI